MTRRDFEREVSEATGESMATIRSRGFSLVEVPDLEPLVVDWDALDEERVVIFPDRGRMRAAA